MSASTLNVTTSDLIVDLVNGFKNLHFSALIDDFISTLGTMIVNILEEEGASQEACTAVPFLHVQEKYFTYLHKANPFAMNTAKS